MIQQSYLEPMEDNTTFQDCEEEAEDTISLCDLPIHGYGTELITDHNNPRTSTDQDLFEFFSDDLGSEMSPNDNNIVFCGKVIPYDENELNEYRKRDYLSVKSSSFHKSHDYLISDDTDRFVSKNRPISNSNRFVAKSESSSVQKVNITAITSMSAKSRRRMFMFGPVKFKPEMEMSAIRKRQSRRAPAPMFPATVGDGETVIGGGSGGGKSQHHWHWGLVRTLGCRSHLATALARSFGCVSTSVV